MLIMSFGKCDLCGTTKLPMLEQEASVTCIKCGKKLKVCTACKTKGCPHCGGVLESAMEWAAKNNIIF